MSTTTQRPTPDFGEPWQNELGDFEIYPRTGGDATAYAEGAKTRDRVIACVNACAGMADPAKEIQAMREAIREAHEMIAEHVSDLDWPALNARKLTAALAKLHPFLP